MTIVKFVENCVLKKLTDDLYYASIISIVINISAELHHIALHWITSKSTSFQLMFRLF